MGYLHLDKKRRKLIQKHENIEFEKGDLRSERVEEQTALEEECARYKELMIEMGKYMGMRVPAPLELSDDEGEIDGKIFNKDEITSCFDDDDSRLFYEKIFD